MSKELIKRILSSIILLPLTVYVMLKGSVYLIFFLVICFLIASFEWNKMTNEFSYKFLGFIFLIFSFYTFYEVSINYDFLYIFFICISTDIGGYVFGKIFKGPKLIKISPNKTYSGMVGGYFLSLVFLFYYFNWINFEITSIWFFITILLSTVSQIGDIIVSFYKRLTKIKNTGKIIPGHGGLLDRIDGMIFAFPIYYLLEITGYII